MSDPTVQDFSGGSSGTGFNYGSAISAAGTLFDAAGTYAAGQGTVAADKAQSAADKAAAAGYGQESQAYTEAAGYAQGNVTLEEESTRIQQYQQQLALGKSLGTQRAEVGAAGFGESGSALALLRASHAQGALAQGLIGVQGEIAEQGYSAQATADTALSEQAIGAENSANAAAAAANSAASSAGTSSALGAAGQAIGAVASIAKMFLFP